MGVKLSAELIEAFAGTFLSPRYDDAKPTPSFHRLAWELYSSPKKQVGCVAPRDHAKSTGLTFDYILAETLFRTADYVILIGSTEDKAAEQLSNISEELDSNEDLRREFGIRAFESQTKTDVIIICDDGHRFRILARGAEQKIRGAMWKGKRPNLIVCDDMEDDEQVENKERRVKFRKWFFRAAKQALSKTGRIRVHGTILHDDSLLSRLMKNSVWEFLFFKAHESYNDFSNLLWPERWTAADLRERQKEFEEDGDAGGYSQEFLNTPLDNNEAYLKKGDLLPMREADYESEKLYGVGVDFAITKADTSNRTSFSVGGKDVANILHLVEQRVGRMDSLEIVETMFEVQQKWRPEVMWVEGGQIWSALAPMVYREMQVRDIAINIEVRQPIKDKATRGRSLQKRTRAGLVRFDKKADWYADYEQEVLKFTGASQAILDDQFDSSALLSMGFDSFVQVEEDDFVEDEEWDMRRESLESRSDQRRNSAGY